MQRALMFGFVDELSKNAGWGDVLGEAVKKHVKPSAKDAADTAKGALSDMLSKGKKRVRTALQDPNLVQKGVEAATAGGGEVSSSPAAEGGKVYLKKRGKGLLGSLGKRLQKMSD